MNITTLDAKSLVLQRKGLTLTEIAEILEVPRAYIVRILYWEKVADK